MDKKAKTNMTTHEKWLDALTIELRLNETSGTSIGDTLSTVQNFLSSSGYAQRKLPNSLANARCAYS